MDRRQFLRAGVAGAILSRTHIAPWMQEASSGIAIVTDPADFVASAPPVRLAIAQLRARLTDVGATVRVVDRIEQAESGDFCIIAGGARHPSSITLLAHAKASGPVSAESLTTITTSVSGRRALLACGADSRGLAYAILDLADRVRANVPALSSIAIQKPAVEQPSNPVRSVMRQFTSEVLDKPWFYDREGWRSYLTMLATHRFNRLHLAFGLGYDSLSRVADSYFLFLYPFLTAVPGYAVRATNLSNEERDRNLETLRFISDETVAHGLDFELGVWMHGYEMPDSPTARYVIEGLTPAAHASYCRDALTTVLRACPSISSVGLRIHGESGVAEGSYDFWGTVFDGVPRAGRAIEIDLHAKGIDTTMIARATQTGMPINLSPKFAAEHCGMPYHQAAIREIEMPVAGHSGVGLMTLSEGSRVFTRYGYADLLREDRTYTVRTRVFSGTQRILAWGDVGSARAYARAFRFCGMTGADLMEPLTCRGRRGTGVGRRDGYLTDAIAPAHDWQKYDDWYRDFGRTMYDPETSLEVFERGSEGDARYSALRSALASASRILPIVTTAHLPSAACDAYWPEVYWNQPIVGEASHNPYSDSPAPKNFQHVSPLDPQLFMSATEHAGELLTGQASGKYSPTLVASWILGLTRNAERQLRHAGTQERAQRRRIGVDVQILAGLGQFFGAKLRCASCFALFERTKDLRALQAALLMYHEARVAWAGLVTVAAGAYQADLSASDKFSERGQWADNLAGIDEDIARMAALVPAVTNRVDPRMPQMIADAREAPSRVTMPVSHTPSAGFSPGTEVNVTLRGPKVRPSSVRLHYRHVNQAERYEVAEMEWKDGACSGVIPAAYTNSPYPLQYYFVVSIPGGATWMYPGVEPSVLGQGYFVLRHA